MKQRLDRTKFPGFAPARLQPTAIHSRISEHFTTWVGEVSSFWNNFSEKNNFSVQLGRRNFSCRSDGNESSTKVRSQACHSIFKALRPDFKLFISFVRSFWLCCGWFIMTLCKANWLYNCFYYLLSLVTLSRNMKRSFHEHILNRSSFLMFLMCRGGKFFLNSSTR